ncbi:MAG: histidine triad nucleotide-binding protein [Elusimicrobiales bacterium]|nr:histidine triad nucleotide-binding protein [Elusimicrobiales bacterium]
MADCIFCKIAAGEMRARLVYENDDVVAFHDLNPQAPAHILIIPRRHVASLSACSEEDGALLGKLQLAAAAIAKENKLENFRLVLNNGKGAGQSVAHLHYHLLGGRRLNWPPG